MKQFLLLGLSVLLLLSCSKEKETPAPAVLISSYTANYMINQRAEASNNYPQAYLLDYSGGKVVKRTGGLRCVLSNSCQDDLTIIENVTNSGSTIYVDTKSGSSSYDVVKISWFFQLKAGNQIAYQLRKIEDLASYDSLRYEYSGSGQLIQITSFYVTRGSARTFVRKKYVKDFFFDTAGNLEKVEKRDMFDNGTVYAVTTEIFGNYDTSINPFQKVFMFDDTFYRSLSKNNFRSYRSETLDVRSGYISWNQTMEWDLQYDEAGVPQFNL